jgi:hypothetical protein
MCHRYLGFMAIAVLALAASACGSSTPAPTPASPTSTAAQSSALPPIWDSAVGTGALPGGRDGEMIFAIELAVEAARFEGVVTAVRGTCPNIGLRVNDRIVRTFERTVFEGQRCSAIAVRDRILVLGRPIDDDLIGALRVTTRKP